MNIYLQLLLVALAVTYIVSVSGFTTSWRSLVARLISTPGHRVRDEDLRALPPFDCGKCMTFWACLAWTIIQGRLDLPLFAACCAASMLSESFSALMIFICETIQALFDKITPDR